MNQKMIPDRRPEAVARFAKLMTTLAYMNSRRSIDFRSGIATITENFRHLLCLYQICLLYHAPRKNATWMQKIYAKKTINL